MRLLHQGTNAGEENREQRNQKKSSRAYREILRAEAVRRPIMAAVRGSELYGGRCRSRLGDRAHLGKPASRFGKPTGGPVPLRRQTFAHAAGLIEDIADTSQKAETLKTEMRNEEVERLRR